MTEEQMAWVYWAEDYCCNDFSNRIPPGVKMFAQKAAEWQKQDQSIQSESIGDISVTYASADVPAGLLRLLRPYRKVKLL